jgi:5'-3' exonuclease
MNGIIHGCTHPAHLDQIENGLSDRDMMLGIMQCTFDIRLFNSLSTEFLYHIPKFAIVLCGI